MKRILNDYEINRSTMALISAANIDYSTIVFEENCRYYVRRKTTDIVKVSCLDGISTYEGRRKAVSHHTGSKQKVPIPINPKKNIFAFPTHSPEDYECNWIFPSHVKKIKSIMNPIEQTIKSKILFNNGKYIELDESEYVLQKQMLRTAMCIQLFMHQAKINNMEWQF